MLLNLALLALIALLGWQLRTNFIAERDRESKFLSSKQHPAPVAPLPPLAKVKPLDPPMYAAMVDRYLFSPDRSPVPIPDPPPPPPPVKPMPALPVAYGVMMWDGIPPTVVLGEPGRAGQKGYHPGDRIGQFTIVSVSNKEVVFEWDEGKKQVTARLDDMLERGLTAARNNQAAPPTQPGAASAPPTAPTQQSSNLGNDNPGQPLGPGAEIPGQGIHACAPGDSSPPGTVVNGLVKKVNTTPFGVTCRWEPGR